MPANEWNKSWPLEWTKRFFLYIQTNHSLAHWACHKIHLIPTPWNSIWEFPTSSSPELSCWSKLVVTSSWHGNPATLQLGRALVINMVASVAKQPWNKVSNGNIVWKYVDLHGWTWNVHRFFQKTAYSEEVTGMCTKQAFTSIHIFKEKNLTCPKWSENCIIPPVSCPKFVHHRLVSTTTCVSIPSLHPNVYHWHRTAPPFRHWGGDDPPCAPGVWPPGKNDPKNLVWAPGCGRITIN